MRVLQVHKDFEPTKGGGGTARHIHGLSEALVQLGCTVRVVSLQPEIADAPYTSEPASLLSMAPHIRWADVVHVHGARSTYAVATAALAWLLRKPFFYTPHAYYGSRTSANAVAKVVWDQLAERFMLSRCSRTVLLTDYWNGYLRGKSLSTKRTTVIPNCISLNSPLLNEADRSARVLPGSPAILSVGRLDRVKRISDIIKALTLPDLAGGHLHVVGRGDERESLEALAASLGVRNRVTFHGFVADEDVAEMMRGGGVFVLASETEGLPTVLLEMLISGLPAAVSRIPGNLGIMNVAQLDWIFDVGDIEGLAKQVLRANGTAVPQTSRNALRREFTWEHRSQDILNMYRDGLDGGRGEALRPTMRDSTVQHG